MIVKGGAVVKVNALSFAKMLRCLTDGPSTIRDVMHETGLHYVTTRDYLTALHKEGVIHICAWDRDSRNGPTIKVYALGEKTDAKRPKQTDGERQARYRNRKRLHAAMGMQ